MSDTEHSPRGIRYPEVTVELVGQDGNPFMLVSRTRTALKRAGVPEPELEEFFEDALSGDYPHVLNTIQAWVSTQ